ncbi:MAG: tRNA pseudouridine(55) synthase TruB [Canibacter sp.]
MSQNAQPSAPGVFLIDKPYGWTSHDVVARARRVFGMKKIGHAGTLDPMATGLLLLGIGPATRLLTYMVGLDKVYSATIRLGQSTPTDDRESDVSKTASAERIHELAEQPELILAAIKQLTGEIDQVPSAVSAIKVAGERAYDLVRKGEQVELKARPITIYRFDAEPPHLQETTTGPVIDVDVTVHCSSGTYIRALARDLGTALGVGGHLRALRRDRVGAFRLEDANSSELFDAAAPPRRARHSEDATAEDAESMHARHTARQQLRVLSPAVAAQNVMPCIEVTTEQATALGHGKIISIVDRALAPAEAIGAIDPQGSLIAIVQLRDDGTAKVQTGFPQGVATTDGDRP